MNDFDYPPSTTRKGYELMPLTSTYPDQLATLKIVRDGLNGDAYFYQYDLSTLHDGDDSVSIPAAVCQSRSAVHHRN
jgi:hypothetical protein